MTDIKFVDELPPLSMSAGDGARARNEQFRLLLRAHPGQWAEYPKNFKGATKSAGATAGNMRRTGVWAGFEVAARGDKVYVRFVGEAVDA